MKKTGIFGGTFDPIHFGHINLALQLMEIHQLDEVIVCPAAVSPFKEHLPPVASADHRSAMIQLAIADIGRFQLSRIELDRSGVSYTVDTLRSFSRKYGETAKLYLLLSEEAIETFHCWKDAEAIIDLACPLIGSRDGARSRIPPSPVQEALKRGLTPTARFEISATQVRDRLKKGLYCGHLVHAKVLDYIQRNSLYS